MVLNGVRGLRFCLCLRNEQIFALIRGSSLLRALSIMSASGSQASRVTMLLPLEEAVGEHGRFSLLVESINDRMLKSAGRLLRFDDGSMGRRFCAKSNSCRRRLNEKRGKTIGLSIERRRRKSSIGRRKRERACVVLFLSFSLTSNRSKGEEVRAYP